MKSALLALGAIAVGLPAGAAAKDPPPAIVQKLLDCRAVTDAAGRLACFDAQAGALGAAIDKQDVVVADKAEIRKARRSLFGLALPDLGALFGSSDKDAGGKEEEAVTELNATLASVSHDANGRLFLVLDDGARWSQIDNRELPVDARAGQKIRIRRAAMGSYMANVNGQIAIRVRRVN